MRLTAARSPNLIDVKFRANVGLCDLGQKRNKINKFSQGFTSIDCLAFTVSLYHW